MPDQPADAASPTASNTEETSSAGRSSAAESNRADAESASSSAKMAMDELTKAVTELSVQAEAKDSSSADLKRTKEEKTTEGEEDDECWAKASLSPSLLALATWIRDGTCRRILVLSGAGVSVAAGIPDFRTPGTGLYDNLQKYNLPFPEAVFDIEFYRHNPKPFVSLAQEIWPGSFQQHQPTLTHSFVTLLERKGLLLRNYTQNIDGLEFLADLSEDSLVECHGHFRSASCTGCRAPADIRKVRDCMVLDAKVAICDECGAYVKPDIVFFGEGLPFKFHLFLNHDKDEADLVLVLGTSLQVAPVSRIPQLVRPNVKRALINRDLVGVFQDTCGGSEQEAEGEADCVNDRDVFIAGDCDDNIRELARLLGWQDELEAMHRDASTKAKAKAKKKKRFLTK